MSFSQIESEIIRDADRDGSLKSVDPQDYVEGMLDCVLDLQERPDRNPEWAIGNLGRLALLFCGAKDLDFTTCIRKARK